MDISADGSEPAPGRESGILEVERKASVVIGSPMNGSPDSPVMSSPVISSPVMNSPLLGGSAKDRPAADRPLVDRPLADGSAPSVAAPVASAAQLSERQLPDGEHGSQPAHDIEIDLEVNTLEQRASALASGATPAGNSPVALDEETIQVLDDEIESADVPPRISLTPGGNLSRPPPPSLRPRVSSTSLPPPRRSSRVGAPLGSSLPPPSDQWILANKTLEIGRAHARIIALEEQVAFRDARIQTLEERLASARQKIEELESRLSSVPSSPRTPLGSPLRSSSTTAASTNASPTKTTAATAASAKTAAATASPVKAAPAKLAPAKARAPQERREDDAFTPEPPGMGDADDLAADDASGNDADDLDLDTDGSRPAAGGPEDLRRINGIGPRFEAALRKQGITRLSQIAAWSDADVRQVAKALKIPKSRIVKGRWVEAAREMIGSRATSE